MGACLIEPGRLGIDLKALAYAAKSANRVGWLAAGKGGTAIDQLDLRYSISNGALAIDPFEARSSTMSFKGAGKVDMRSRLLDMTVTLGAAVALPVPASPAKPVQAVQPTTPPEPNANIDVLVIRGDWTDPAISMLGRPFTTSAPTVNGASVVSPVQIPQR